MFGPPAMLLLLPAVLGEYARYPPGGSCNVNGPANSLCIGAPVSDSAVLQRDAKTGVTGSVPVGYGEAPMTITVTLTEEAHVQYNRRPAGVAVAPAATIDTATTTSTLTVVSTVVRDDLTWKAYLPPKPAFGNYTLTAACTAGCPGRNGSATTVTLVNLTYGDVYVCSGQSNMQLMIDYTFDVNETVAAIQSGERATQRTTK